MRTAALKEITSAIETAADRNPGGAVAFDGDGTLWSGDVGEDFFVALLEHGLHEASHAALVREAKAENVDASGSARDVAHRIHQAYLANHFPEERVCEIMTWAAAGWTKSQLDAFCDQVVEKIGLRKRLHGEAIHIVRHLHARKIDVHLVSASPRAIVDAAARIVGIDPSMAIAAREKCDAATSVVECAVERPIPYGDGKVTRLRERLGASRVLYAAFGDNAFDVPMLRESKIPVAIRPKQRLIDRAPEVPDMVILERAEMPA